MEIGGGPQQAALSAVALPAPPPLVGVALGHAVVLGPATELAPGLALEPVHEHGPAEPAAIVVHEAAQLASA